jgi:hypothetical protein
MTTKSIIQKIIIAAVVAVLSLIVEFKLINNVSYLPPTDLEQVEIEKYIVLLGNYNLKISSWHNDNSYVGAADAHIKIQNLVITNSTAQPLSVAESEQAGRFSYQFKIQSPEKIKIKFDTVNIFSEDMQAHMAIQHQGSLGAFNFAALLLAILCGLSLLVYLGYSFLRKPQS